MSQTSDDSSDYQRSISNSSNLSHLSQTSSIDIEQCKYAIMGAGLPEDLDHATTQASVVRGIRCSHEFATSPAVTRLCKVSIDHTPQFERARNARLIMSNEIPEAMDDPKTQPYCIWYPDFATEDTYRKLASRYSSMRYHVGRACAAAGYSGLYHELDLLPDVSIAEEARESQTDGGRRIYNTIMAAPFKFAVMDDYTRSVELANPVYPAFLNANTAVRSRLQRRVAARQGDLYKPVVDIEEDLCVDVVSSDLPESYETLTQEHASLLYNPLPLDLPTMKKQLLIQMAAYEGNVDRYARLTETGSLYAAFRRLQLLDSTEIVCVVRGIYHHTMFARWWSAKLETDVATAIHESVRQRIKRAVNARRIMINEISTIDESTPHKEIPYLIWWPLKPHEGTLHVLAKKLPFMMEQIIIAAIFCDYKTLYNRFNFTPHWHMWLACEQNGDPYYKEDLKRRGKAQNIEVTRGIATWTGETETVRRDLEPTDIFFHTSLTLGLMCDQGMGEGIYEGYSALTYAFERYVWVPPDVHREIEEHCDGYWVGPEINPFDN